MERWPTPKRLAEGRKAKTLCELTTGALTVPAGAVVRITQYFSNWANVVGEPCACCGVSIHMRKVPISRLELLPVDHAELKAHVRGWEAE